MNFNFFLVFTDFSATLPRPNLPKPDHSRDENPIPLPPRDRNKPLLTAKARHTRKHPLIIPPTSLQRTLDKVNMGTPPATSPELRTEEVFASTVSNFYYTF